MKKLNIKIMLVFSLLTLISTSMVSCRAGVEVDQPKTSHFNTPSNPSHSP